MKKSDVHHPIFGESTRPAQRAKIGDLQWRNDSVLVKGGYNVSLNDSIVFPNRIEDFEIFLQPVSYNADQYQTHISVLKNGKPSYVSLGCLFRQDAFSQYTCEFGRRLGEMKDDLERVLLLVGNQIRCNKLKETVFWKRNSYDGKVILPRERFSAKCPIIEYDGINAAALAGLMDSRLFKGLGELALAEPDIDVDEDGFWPFGKPIRRLYKAAIDGIVHIVLEALPPGERKTDCAGGATTSNLKRLLDSSDVNTPVELVYRRPHLHNVAICPIREIIPHLEDKEIWFDPADHFLVVDEKLIIEEV